MCGIAGAVRQNPSGSAAEDAVRSVRSMLPLLARRGPDAEGLHQWGGSLGASQSNGPRVVFGHRRLSILDLSPAGAQPMLSRDGRTGVVFNGCIYNFRAIRTELEARGHQFHSQCDTEILVEGYLEWGIDGLLPRLHGMFAFAIWDDVKRVLFLARDRLGVKPLIYRISNGNLEFASNLQALLAAGGSRDLDPQAVMDYLDFGFVTDTRCIVLGVDKLAPATVLEWRDGKATVRQYWDLPPFGEAKNTTFENAVDEAEELLLEAVRLRLVSDVPIGALLSGGIDSTLVCWALSKLNTDVRAFTVGTPGDAEDESADASAIARQLGIQHEIVAIDTNEAAPMEELGNAYGEPFASTSALGVLRVSRAVRRKATVLLTGDGGDDVFLGYPIFRNAWTAQKIAKIVPGFVAGMWPTLRPLVSAFPALKRPRSLLDYSLGGIGPYAGVRDGLPWFAERGMLGEKLRGLTVAHREIAPSFESAQRILADVFQFHRRMHFTSEFMPKVDGGTTHHSLEARAPLLDQKLWEFAVQLPPEIQFHGGQMKAVLREIVRRRVGPDVAFRRKRGFSIPVEKWLAAKWSGQLQALKRPNVLTREGWFDAKALGKAVDDGLRDKSVAAQLWYLLVLENWMRR